MVVEPIASISLSRFMLSSESCRSISLTPPTLGGGSSIVLAIYNKSLSRKGWSLGWDREANWAVAFGAPEADASWYLNSVKSRPRGQHSRHEACDRGFCTGLSTGVDFLTLLSDQGGSARIIGAGRGCGDIRAPRA